MSQCVMDRHKYVPKNFNMMPWSRIPLGVVQCEVFPRSQRNLKEGEGNLNKFKEMSDLTFLITKII